LGAAALKDRTECSYALHATAPAACADFRISDCMEWKLLEEIPVRVLHTPGHTRDSVSLVLPGFLLSGDALFLDDGGAGRDDLPGGDPAAHWESLERIRSLPDDLVVLPAHDYRKRKPSSLAQQKRTNPHLKPRTKQEFVDYINDLKLGPADWMADVLKANYACARDPKAAWIPADTAACEVQGTLGVNDISVSSVPVAVLAEKLRSAEPPLMLDVREKEELAGELGALPGVMNVPIARLARKLGELEPHKDHEIVVVCRSGGRAQTAAQILGAAGFTRVQVLAGGMLAWRAQEQTARR
jgi:sulfur dioxygenase